MLGRSIRSRLLLWLGLLLACILTGFGITAYQLFYFNQLSQIDESLQSRLAALETDLRSHGPFGLRNRGRFEPDRGPSFSRSFNSSNHGGPGPGFGPGFDPGGPDGEPPMPDMFFGGPDHHKGGPPGELDSRAERLASQTLNQFQDADTNGFYFVIWSRSGERLRASTNAPAGLAMPSVAYDTAAACLRNRDDYREAFKVTDFGDCLLAGRLLASDLKSINQFGWELAAGGFGILALGLTSGWILIGRALCPIHSISATAGQISAGDLSQRINTPDTGSELGELAAILNSTFARLDAAFSEQRRFTADASHELRTPLAVMICEAQTALARTRSPEDYRETIEVCLSTAQQMRRLTESLLQLARFDAGQQKSERKPTDLAALAKSSAELIRPLAAQREIQIHTDLSPALVQADADQLTQVINNLLSNAVHYNREHGEIRVSTRMELNSAILTVADTGWGISAEDLPHIFKRFYRADKSRARAEGRSGLGLAICRAIVETHGGSIQAVSHLDAGTVFTVRLPLA
jgi:signal transduction histidine kinase